MKEFGIYICICHFFFVPLRPKLLCAYVYACMRSTKEHMKVVLLVAGHGTRISEEIIFHPKPVNI